MSNADDVVILVDFPDEQGLIYASRGSKTAAEWAEKSEEALQSALDVVRAMTRRISTLYDSVPDEITEAEVQFGVKLTAEAGAILTRAGVEGMLNVTLKWERAPRTIAAVPSASVPTAATSDAPSQPMM